MSAIYSSKLQWLRWFAWRRILLLFFLVAFKPNICQGINYRPSFTRSSLVKTIPENVGGGYLIADVSDYTVDDEGDVITYSLDSYGSQICDIGQKTGRLTLKKPLDREVQAQFKIIVSAQDSHQGGGQHRTAMLPVFLYVLDVNDNAPAFIGTPYIATVPENATIGKSIFTVEASDPDDGQNKDITFSFKKGKGAEKFSIDPDTGIVKLAAKLDYEIEKKYALVVIAKDKGTPQNLESHTTLVIDVIDVRDTKPIFKQSSYQIQIHENQPLGASVLRVTAVDGDSSLRHPVRYEIIQGNDEGLFTINQITGTIKVNGTLDREDTNIFKLQVKAWEVPDVTSFAVVNVIILLNDINDNKPVFKKKHYFFTVKEDVLPGHVLTEQFDVVDRDIEKVNNQFEYSLEGGDGKFSINPFSGRLQVSGFLDYEKQTNYTLTIRATEANTKERYNSTANVTIDVINVNDNPPVFQKMVYIFTVFENITTEEMIGQVKAVDKDSGSFGHMLYQIQSNRIGAPLFVINSNTGEIYTTKSLDYSKAEQHRFIVTATDGGGDESRTGKALVQITVLKVEKRIKTTRISTVITTVKTLGNKIPDEVEDSELEASKERTISASIRTISTNSTLCLIFTLLSLLRVLVT